MVHISPTIQLGDILWNRSSTLGGQWRSELQHSILHSVFFLFNHITNSTLKDVHVPFLVFGHYIPRPGPRGAVVDGFVRG